MKEIDNAPEDLKTQEAVIRDALEQFLKTNGTKTLNIVYEFQTKKHAALKLVSRKMQTVHFATVFAQTEYDGPNDKPSSFEVKVDSRNLTNKNIAIAAMKFLADEYPQTLSSQINIYRNLKNFKYKKPYALIPSNQLAAA